MKMLCRLLLSVTFIVAADIKVPAIAAPATSETISYRAKKGDSLELLAAEYYGDRNHAVFIMVTNKITHPRDLKSGETLKIPISREVTTAPGDTFESLAQKYLGDTRRGKFLAEFNSASTANSIAAGAVIAVPFHVQHTSAGNETLASIAAAYFANANNADMLKRYNFLDSDKVSKGEKIVVPIFHVKVRASKLPPAGAEARQRTERRRVTTAQIATLMPIARAAWRSGDYAAIKRSLTGIDFDYLDAETAVDVGLLLASSYVAFDDVETALAIYRKVIERKTNVMLDQYGASPKILEVWQRAGGKVTEPSSIP